MDTAADVAFENFGIVCLAMGQGDCTLIRCPDASIVMIDCGSKAYLDYSLTIEAQKLVRDKALAGRYSKIDALILTHSDRDHYNQLLRVVGAFQWTDDKKKVTDSFTALDVDKIYFSSTAHPASTSPLYHYSENGVDNGIYTNTLKTSEIHEVTINATANSYKTWVKADGFKDVNKTTSISNKILPILSGTTKNNKNWSVSIIAGNVPSDKSLKGDVKETSTEDNAASLVTLLQFDTAKALFCGDATHSTEAFLLAQHKNLISNIDLLHVPHHGSESSSGAAFVTQTNPKATVVSVGHMETSHKLPRYEVLDRWLELMEKQQRQAAEHACDSWYYEPNKLKETFDDWLKKKYSIFSNENKKQGKNASYWWLSQIMEDHAYYVIADTGYMLYRDKVQLPMWQTSTLGQTQKRFLQFSLPL
ncbi:MAG TPA: MBL fold metallo-hydrolase [Pyrinomonadaceae bacterium]|jgi:beta-lactamase superfamily II metal-dependent hydrolase